MEAISPRRRSQVLLSPEADRLTTTRVAERAGVSVGTLYQYYPNKQSLLFAVLEDHLDRVSAVVEAARRRARGKPLAEMVKDGRGVRGLPRWSVSGYFNGALPIESPRKSAARIGEANGHGRRRR